MFFSLSSSLQIFLKPDFLVYDEASDVFVIIRHEMTATAFLEILDLSAIAPFKNLSLSASPSLPGRLEAQSRNIWELEVEFSA
jgi:hypothetical protein